MKLLEYRKKQAEVRQKEIFDWWKENGEDAKKTALQFEISRAYVYKIIRRFYV